MNAVSTIVGITDYFGGPGRAVVLVCMSACLCILGKYLSLLHYLGQV